jgi:hypothetical protein
VICKRRYETSADLSFVSRHQPNNGSGAVQTGSAALNLEKQEMEMVGPWGLEPQTSTVSTYHGLER